VDVLVAHITRVDIAPREGADSAAGIPGAYHAARAASAAQPGSQKPTP